MMGRKSIDLTGQKFNMLTVINKIDDYVSSSGRKRHRWKCLCDCGNTTIVTEDNLKSGHTQSCGCLKHKSYVFIDLTGQKFGKLTVIERVENDKNGKVQYLCQCNCGNEKIIRADDLRSGNTQTCGCSHNKSCSMNLIGLVFNKLTVLKQIENKINSNKQSAQWLCLCDCGNETTATTNQLRGGHKKSCGCLSVEKAKERKGSKHPNWNGNSEIRLYLRKKINQWKLDSAANCNFKCIINGDNNFQIHHLYPFNKIINETIKLSKLKKYTQIKEYTDDELKLLSDIFLKLHYKYGFGICLSKELHYEFHSIYGKVNFTPENFYKFYKEKTGKNFDSSFLMVNKNIEQNNIKEAI